MRRLHARQPCPVPFQGVERLDSGRQTPHGWGLIGFRVKSPVPSSNRPRDGRSAGHLWYLAVMGERYLFEDTWSVPDPIETVWRMVDDLSAWPRWLPDY